MAGRQGYLQGERNYRPVGRFPVALWYVVLSMSIPTHSLSLLVRDTLGTALYFAEYDVFRYLLGRDPLTDRQGPVPDWAKSWLPASLIPFSAGAVAGVTSWALIYPVDVSLFRLVSFAP